MKLLRTRKYSYDELSLSGNSSKNIINIGSAGGWTKESKELQVLL
jgi:hypothetical protein